MAPRNSHQGGDNSNTTSRKRVAHLDKDSEEYRKHRERNNQAVKRSRNKSKQRAQETQAKVAQLRAENESLNAKIKILNKELSFLKDLFLAHAGATGNRSLEGIDFSFLNEDTSRSEDSSLVKVEHA